MYHLSRNRMVSKPDGLFNTGLGLPHYRITTSLHFLYFLQHMTIITSSSSYITSNSPVNIPIPLVLGPSLTGETQIDTGSQVMTTNDTYNSCRALQNDISAQPLLLFSTLFP